MREEIRLASIGWPLSDAITFCNTMRRDREDLEGFVLREEAEYMEKNHGLCLL